MKRLFYVRHGETEMNVSLTLSGRTETELTDLGKDQARKAGRKIRTQLPSIDLIICSPLGRTLETAKLIAKEISYEETSIVQNDLFTERSFGVLEGTLAHDFLGSHEYKEFDKVEGAETIKQLDVRANRAFEYICGLKDFDNILIVGHGAFGRAIRRVTSGLPYTDEYKKQKFIDNADIIELV